MTDCARGVSVSRQKITTSAPNRLTSGASDGGRYCGPSTFTTGPLPRRPHAERRDDVPRHPVAVLARSYPARRHGRPGDRVADLTPTQQGSPAVWPAVNHPEHGRDCRRVVPMLSHVWTPSATRRPRSDRLVVAQLRSPVAHGRDHARRLRVRQRRIDLPADSLIHGRPPAPHGSPVLPTAPRTRTRASPAWAATTTSVTLSSPRSRPTGSPDVTSAPPAVLMTRTATSRRPHRWHGGASLRPLRQSA